MSKNKVHTGGCVLFFVVSTNSNCKDRHSVIFKGNSPVNAPSWLTLSWEQATESQKKYSLLKSITSNCLIHILHSQSFFKSHPVKPAFFFKYLWQGNEINPPELTRIDFWLPTAAMGHLSIRWQIVVHSLEMKSCHVISLSKLKHNATCHHSQQELLAFTTQGRSTACLVLDSPCLPQCFLGALPAAPGKTSVPLLTYSLWPMVSTVACQMHTCQNALDHRSQPFINPRSYVDTGCS